MNDNQLVKSVKDLEHYLEKTMLPSIGFRAMPLNLLPHEVYFMTRYKVRFKV